MYEKRLEQKGGFQPQYRMPHSSIPFFLNYLHSGCRIWLNYECMRILSIILGAIPRMAKR